VGRPDQYSVLPAAFIFDSGEPIAELRVIGGVDARGQFHISGRDTVVSREEYLRFAAECWIIAETVDNSSSKAQLLAMAAAWRKLAEFVSSPGLEDDSQDR
jgi:hypothetical protein